MTLLGEQTYQSNTQEDNKAIVFAGGCDVVVPTFVFESGAECGGGDN